MSHTIEFPGVIDRDAVYTKPEFLRRVGWGEDAFRLAKRRGLKVRYLATRCFVAGQAFLEYLETTGKDEKDSPSLT